MELAKHGTTDENGVKRYISPKATVIFVKAQNVLCVSPGNEPMSEFDYGDAGFGEV